MNQPAGRPASARGVGALDRVTAEVRALENLDLNGLRAAWRERYGPPPRMRSPDLLRRLLAWRIQSDALGGLDRKTARAVSSDAAPTPPKPKVREGVRLSREWQGRTYEVEAVDGGFVLNGTSYASLSEAARAITGVRWNGPRFFGLREKAA